MGFCSAHLEIKVKPADNLCSGGLIDGYGFDG